MQAARLFASLSAAAQPGAFLLGGSPDLLIVSVGRSDDGTSCLRIGSHRKISPAH